MNAGVVAALAVEARLLCGKRIRRGAIGSGRSGLAVICSGMGAANAEKAARLLVDQGAMLLISWGTAGGLADRVAPGDLMLPRRVIGCDGAILESDENVVGVLRSRLREKVTCRMDSLAEGAGLLGDEAAKRRLGDETGAAAVDMESATVARVARDSGCGFVAIRAIVDQVDLTMPRSLVAALEDKARPNDRRALQLVPGPRDCRAWIRLGLGWKRACTSLREAAHVLAEMGAADGRITRRESPGNLSD